MLDPRWRKVVRDLTSHRVRTALVVLSIAVGIFAVGVVLGGRGILDVAFGENFAKSNPRSIEFVTSPFDEHLLRRLEADPKVAEAEGRSTATLRFKSERVDGWKTMPLTAADDWATARINRVFPEEGTPWPPARGEVVLERSVRQLAKFKVGDTIRIETAEGKMRTLRVSGFAHDINAFPAMFTARYTAFVSPSTLGMLDADERTNDLLIRLKPGFTTRAEVSREAAKLRDDILEPAGISVYATDAPEPGSHRLRDIFAAVSMLLQALGVLALALSGFLVVTTVQAILAQHTKQVGIMKAVGGRRDQITRMYLAMVVGFGVLAVCVGVPVGTWWARWFADYAGGLLNFGSTARPAPAWVFALEVAVGVAVPLGAAAGPIWLAMRLPVVRAFTDTGTSSAKFGDGIIDRALALMRGLPRPVALSLRNTFQRKGRLLLTLATLTLASAVVMAVMSVRVSMLTTVDDLSSWWHYDAEVNFGRPANAQAVEREAKRTQGVTGVESWILESCTFRRPDGSENDTVFTIGLPVDTKFIVPKLVSGRWLRPGATDEVVVNTDLISDESSIEVGKTIHLKMVDDERDWKVVGVVSGQLMGPSVFADRQYLDGVLARNGSVDRTLVQTTEHGKDAELRIGEALEQRMKDLGYTVSAMRTMQGLHDNVANQFGILVTFLVIMAVILALVGVIGLTGTMTINVLESTREIGVMRSIGASHFSIYGIFITEGIVVGVLSWALGAVLAYPISYALTKLLEQAIKVPLTYVFSFTGVFVWLAIVIAISAFASLLPAFRASQVSVRDAISYE